MDRSTYNTATSRGQFSEYSVRVPGFHALKRAGVVLPENPYRFDRSDASFPWRFDRLSEVWVNESSFGGVYSFATSARAGYYVLQYGGVESERFHSIEDAHAILRNKLAAQVRESPVNLGNSLGEYRETASMFASACRKLVPLARAARKKDFSLALRTITGRTNRRPSDAAMAAADAWLGWTYGVKPLASDISGSLELLSKKDPIVVVGKATVTHKSRCSGSAEKIDNSGLTRAFGLVEGRIKGRAHMEFYVDNPLAFAADQLGLLNPVALTYELIPLSFVLDWFVPVGAYLTGVVPPWGLSNFRGYTYVKAQGVTRRTTAFQPPAGDFETTMTERGFVKDRAPIDSWPKVTLIVPDISLNREQVMSGISLLTQAIGGR